MKSQSGFTLIELMLVTAIIGVLATIATGSFLTYQAKAKQAEAKINLGSIGELVLSYKVEHDTYVTDWIGIGWSPNTTTRYRFWYNGVAMAGTPTVVDVGVDYSDPGSVVTSDTFTAAAIGNIDRDTSTDQWLYDQNRSLTALQTDVTTP
jgi:type IV pilus assembly protein PilA